MVIFSKLNFELQVVQTSSGTSTSAGSASSAIESPLVIGLLLILPWRLLSMLAVLTGRALLKLSLFFLASGFSVSLT